MLVCMHLILAGRGWEDDVKAMPRLSRQRARADIEFDPAALKSQSKPFGTLRVEGPLCADCSMGTMMHVRVAEQQDR